jgi:predicted nucleic acid-binding protein
VVGYLVDTSVLHRVGRSSEIADRVATLRNENVLWTCDLVSLELGYSARNAQEWAAIASVQRRLRDVPITATVTGRALEVHGLLAAAGHHRVPVSDLLIASAAEAASVAVLHYDSDFDVIAGVTKQPVEWAQPAGSVD